MDYPWYELLENCDDITQGDIVKNCPVPILSDNQEILEGSRLQASVEVIDGIILTQACDIENKKVDSVILCEITSKTDFENNLRQNEGKNQHQVESTISSIIKGQQNALHIINNYKTEHFSQDYYIISFKNIYSVPIDFLKSIAKRNGKRLRLCPPYREHLSQAFARYFMRVGLPINIKIE